MGWRAGKSPAPVSLVPRADSVRQIRTTRLAWAHVDAVASGIGSAEEGEGPFERRARNVHAVAERCAVFARIHEDAFERSQSDIENIVGRSPPVRKPGHVARDESKTFASRRRRRRNAG